MNHKQTKALNQRLMEDQKSKPRPLQGKVVVTSHPSAPTIEKKQYYVTASGKDHQGKNHQGYTKKKEEPVAPRVKSTGEPGFRSFGAGQ